MIKDLNQPVVASLPPSKWRGAGLFSLAFLAAAVLLLVLAFNTHPAAAQGGGDTFQLPPGVTWDQVNAVARNMFCDVCAGIPLDECESVACQQWREEIARQLGEGRTKDEIIDYFTQRYGSDVSAIPRNKTDRTLAYGVIVVAVLAIALVGGDQARRMRKRGQTPGQGSRRAAERLQTRPVPDDFDPALLERLERDLERLDS